MELVILVVVLALAQYSWFAAKVGMAREKYQVKAPAITGHPVFERLYRVQMNTLEQLLLFLPAMWMFPTMAVARGWPGHEIAAGFGVVWIIGRAVYARSYVRDPATRALGFMLTLLPSLLMLLMALGLVFLSII
jgi:glutathione S-transferase